MLIAGIGDWFSGLANALDEAIKTFSKSQEDYSFFWLQTNVNGMIAIILVALICGMVGSLVVGNRLAFFSDALAHCAFAGVAFALMVFLFVIHGFEAGEIKEWTRVIMVLFGVVVGLGIAWVQEKTSLANDTVIGVFFAGAVGLGAVFMKAVSRRSRYFNLENFLFGSPMDATAGDLLLLAGLVVVTLVFMIWNYNSLVFTSFNSSLARSRQVSIRLSNYLFIALLGVIVNLCLSIVGALLINALLIVPAATAANVSRNMRQLFWLSIFLCLGVGVSGHLLSWQIQVPDPASREPIQFGISGIIVVLSVIAFFISMAVGPVLRRWPSSKA